MKLVFGVLPLLVFINLIQAQDPRVTPAVKVIEKIQAGILPIFCGDQSGMASGSGVLIHEQGYILTADHVTQAREGVVIVGLERVPYKVVGRLPERDLAIVKADLPRTIAAIRVGRSHDLRTGEPVIVGGNPGGRGLVMSQGTINSPSIDPSWPSLLAKTYFRDGATADAMQTGKAPSTGGRPEYIQFDAMSNPGTSGGALLNIHGELIGMVVAGSKTENSVNWAIPIDRIRLWFPYFIQPEERGQFWTGVTVDLLAAEAKVTGVAPSSPAAEADIQAGDVIQMIDGTPLRCGLDWCLNLEGREKGASVNMTLQRQGMTLTKALHLRDYPTPAVTREGKKPGLNFSIYRGRSGLQSGLTGAAPNERGELSSISVDEIKGREKENFAVAFEGYLEFPEAGLYRIWLGADDGAELFLDGRLLIDNGLNHPYQELSRTVLAPKGLVPLRLEYFQGRGEARLTLAVRPDGSAVSDPAMELNFWRDVREVQR